ncbi:MAG: YybS family protein [Desulfosudaceae bacterium]
MPQAASNGISRDIMQGVAVASLIFLVSVWLPVMGLVGLLALPLPIFYYRAKLGRKNGLIVLVVTAGVMTAVIRSFSPDLVFVTGLLLLGFVLCELVEKGLPLEPTILLTGGLILLTGILGLMIYSLTAGTGPVALLSTYVARNLELSLALYRDMGMPEENVRLIEQSRETIGYYLVRILPAISAAFILMETWITFLGARSIFKKKGVGFPDFGALNQWQSPEYLVWGVIGSGILMLIPQPALRIIGLNLMIILMTIYFFQGIAIVSYYFDRKKWPVAPRVFVYTLIAVWHLLLLLVVSLGFFDTWADFRRLKTSPDQGEQGPPQ